MGGWCISSVVMELGMMELLMMELLMTELLMMELGMTGLLTVSPEGADWVLAARDADADAAPSSATSFDPRNKIR